MGMQIDGLSDIYSDYSDIYSEKDTGSKLKTELDKKDYANCSDDELLEACKEFETYFTEQVFKAMQKMVPNSEETSSNQYMEMFNDNLIKEYAASATSQNEGLGIANMLYEQMKRNYGVDTVPAVDITEAAEAVDISDKVKEIK